MPLPSSPTSQATVPLNSSSLDALDLLPSLSLSRWIRMSLRLPSGRKRGMKKQETPGAAPAVCAVTKKPSHIGADVNHLWPFSRQVPSPAGDATRGVGAHVGAALLLGHAHADQRAALAGDRRRSAGRTRA